MIELNQRLGVSWEEYGGGYKEVFGLCRRRKPLPLGIWREEEEESPLDFNTSATLREKFGNG